VRHRSLQAENIRYHANSIGHKFAEASWFGPDEPVCITLQATQKDDQLMSGAVPQPTDWLRAFRISRDPRSWQAAEHDDETSNFICQIRHLAVQRRSWKQLCVAMAEVVRDRKREALRFATTISIAFDDKASRKLLMFKCDTPGLPSMSCLDADKTLLPYGARLAMIGCMPPDLPKMSEYDDDYARRTARNVVQMFERFCSRGGQLDASMLESLLQKVRFVCVDGALVKTANLLRTSGMPNIALIVRDPAHVIRTSTANPIQHADGFDEQYARLFSNRHAVLKDFNNSHVWQDMLQAIQADIVKEGGSMGGGVRSVLRNMAFVQPRFESEATPRRRYVCLLRAIAHVLMVKAYDSRQPVEVRRRAVAALAAMERRSDAVMAGLAGDYGEACVEFLRVFDVDDHDVARTIPELTGFLKFLDEMFLQGRVFADVRFTDEAAPNEGSRKTLARIAYEEVGNEYTVSYGIRKRTLWRDGGVAFKEECRTILGSLGGVVRDVKDRMNAEIGRRDLQAAFVAFDLDAWSRAIARAEKKPIHASMLDARYTRTELSAAATRLCKALIGIEEEDVGPDWMRMVQRALEERSRMRIGPRRASTECVRAAAWDVAESHPMIDNRMVWRLVLDGGGVPDRLRPAVLAYFGCLHGTGCVERGLGRDKRAVVEPHVGSSRPSAKVEEENSKLLELHRDGPRREQDLFVRSADSSGVMLLTDFSRACAARWLETHGRRFGATTKVRKDAGVAETRALGRQTDAALRRGVKSCFAKIAQEANASSNAACLDAADASTRPTILGEPRKDLMRKVRKTQEPKTVTKGTQKYRELTKKKAREKDAKRAAAGEWAGWSLDQPVLRLGGAAAVRAASSCAAAQGALARRWLAKNPRREAPKRGKVKAAERRQVPRRPAAPSLVQEARPVSAGASGVALGSAVRPAPRSSTAIRKVPGLSEMMGSSTLTVKGKLHDGSSADDLRSWVVAVAFGKFVNVNDGLGGIKRVAMRSALGRSRDVWFTPTFVERHPELEKITSAIAKSKGSQWRVWPNAPPGRASSSDARQEIDSTASFARWLRRFQA